MKHLLPLLLLACAPETTTDEPLLERYTLSDSVGFPEGVAFHATSRAFVMGSLEHGGITRLDADGTETRIVTADADWTTLGTKVGASGAIHMCAVQFPSTDDARSQLWIVDIDDGLTSAVDLQGSPNNCNDVVEIEGTVYLTDREAGRIHRVDLATDTAEIWFEDEVLDPELIGLNGIVHIGDALLVGKYSPPRLFRIPLADPAAFTEVTLDGDPLGTLPDGFDGIIEHEGDLFIAGNKNLVQLSSTDNWITATATTTQPEVPIAAVTIAEGQIYGLKGEIVPSVLGLPVDLPFELVAL